MLKLGRVTKVKVHFLLLVFVFNFDLFKFSAAILEKGLLEKVYRSKLHTSLYFDRLCFLRSLLSFSQRLLRASAIMVWHFVAKQYWMPGNQQLSRPSKRSWCYEHRWFFWQTTQARALKGRWRYVWWTKLNLSMAYRCVQWQKRRILLQFLNRLKWYSQQSPCLQSIYSKRLHAFLLIQDFQALISLQNSSNSSPVNSSWLWWIIRVVLTNQKRGNLLIE